MDLVGLEVGGEAVGVDVVLVRDAVVADEGEGQDQDLAAVTVNNCLGVGGLGGKLGGGWGLVSVVRVFDMSLVVFHSPRIGERLRVSDHSSVKNNLASHILVGSEGETLVGSVVGEVEGSGGALELKAVGAGGAEEREGSTEGGEGGEGGVSVGVGGQGAAVWRVEGTYVELL